MDRDHKRELLRALADQGRASGMEAAAEVILEIAKSHTRVVGTNTLRDVAAALKEKAKATRESGSMYLTYWNLSATRPHIKNFAYRFEIHTHPRIRLK